MLTEQPALIRRVSSWLRSTQEGPRPHSVSVLDASFEVLPGVFSPSYYSETAFYAESLKPLFGPGCRFLDVGCGAGVNSIFAARAGASVVALDINEKAVENTLLNARLHEVEDQVDARVSDVFAALHVDEQFDLIYWNVPFTYRLPTARLSTIEEAIFDPGYRKNRAYIEGSGSHTTPDGCVLMGISPTLGHADLITSIADESGFTVSLVAEATEVGTGETLQLVRLLSAPPPLRSERTEEGNQVGSHLQDLMLVDRRGEQ